MEKAVESCNGEREMELQRAGGKMRGYKYVVGSLICTYEKFWLGVYLRYRFIEIFEMLIKEKMNLIVFCF